VVGFAVFKQKPTSVQVRSFLGRAIGKAGTAPKYIICDQDSIFIADDFKKWCRLKKIRIRYGAVGEHGSIAIIERFIRSFKTECTRNFIVPYRREVMRREITLYCAW
jgi:transposase InsO family protein